MWSGAKAVGCETLRTGDKIQTDIAARKSNDFVSAGEIVSKDETESAQNLFSKLGGRGSKAAREATRSTKRGPRGLKPQNIKRARKMIKRDNISCFYYIHTSAADIIMSASAAEIASVSSEVDNFVYRPIQTSVLGTIEDAYKPIAPWNKTIWNFYSFLHIELYD